MVKNIKEVIKKIKLEFLKLYDFNINESELISIFFEFLRKYKSITPDCDIDDNKIISSLNNIFLNIEFNKGVNILKRIIELSIPKLNTLSDDISYKFNVILFEFIKSIYINLKNNLTVNNINYINSFLIYLLNINEDIDFVNNIIKCFSDILLIFKRKNGKIIFKLLRPIIIRLAYDSVVNFQTIFFELFNYYYIPNLIIIFRNKKKRNNFVSLINNLVNKYKNKNIFFNILLLKLTKFNDNYKKERDIFNNLESDSENNDEQIDLNIIDNEDFYDNEIDKDEYQYLKEEYKAISGKEIPIAAEPYIKKLVIMNLLNSFSEIDCFISKFDNMSDKEYEEMFNSDFFKDAVNEFTQLYGPRETNNNENNYQYNVQKINNKLYKEQLSLRKIKKTKPIKFNFSKNVTKIFNKKNKIV